MSRMNKPKKEKIGRPPKLNDSESEILFSFVKTSYISKRPANYKSISDFIFSTFTKVVTEDCLWHMINRDSRLKTIQGHPMESVRTEVPLEVIEEHYERLESILQSEDIPPQFVLNVDESGFQEFVDAKDMILVIPSDAPESEMVFPVNRNPKRATLIGCISADGTALKPFIVSPNKTIEKELRLLGYREDVVTLVSQANGFINAATFAYWADTVLFPEIKRRRVQYGFKGTAILLLDGCSSHFSDYFLDECSFHGVFPFQEPAGSSDQVQALDLGIFGIQKSMKSKTSKFKGLSENSKNIIGIVDSWIKSTTPSNIVSAFGQAGIYSVSENDREIVHASIKYARAVRGISHEQYPTVITGSKTEKLIEF